MTRSSKYIRINKREFEERFAKAQLDKIYIMKDLSTYETNFSEHSQFESNIME